MTVNNIWSAATLQGMKNLGVQALFFQGVNIFKSGLAPKNLELRRPASLIEANSAWGFITDNTLLLHMVSAGL